MFKTLRKLLEAKLALIEERIEEYNKRKSLESYYIEVGKAISDIEGKYPSSYKDACIVYEEWCKGLILECRPSKDMLREYAKMTGNANTFRMWTTNRLNPCCRKEHNEQRATAQIR